jgi:hypothetical protein
MSDVLAPDHDPEPAPLERATLHTDTLADAARLVPEKAPTHLRDLVLAHLDDAVRTGLDVVCRYGGDRAGIFFRTNRATLRRYVSEYAVESLVQLLMNLEDDTAPPLPPPPGDAAPPPPPVESSRPGRTGVPRHRSRPLGDDDESTTKHTNDTN